MRRILAVFSIFLGCASRPSPQPLIYTFTDHLLTFERDGNRYAVSDPATVERARVAIHKLERAERILNHLTQPASYGSCDFGRYDCPSRGFRPAYEPTDEERAAMEAMSNIQNRSLQISDDAAGEGTSRRRAAEDVSRAERDLRRIIDQSIAWGLAQLLS